MLLAHQALHFGDADERFLIDVGVTGGSGGPYDICFVGELAVALALDDLEAGPTFTVVDVLTLGEGVYAGCPLGEIIGLGDYVGDFFIREQRWTRKIVLCQLKEGFSAGTALISGLAESAPAASGEFPCADQGQCARRAEHVVAQRFSSSVAISHVEELLMRGWKMVMRTVSMS